jgi:hypothetical protein
MSTGVFSITHFGPCCLISHVLILALVASELCTNAMVHSRYYRWWVERFMHYANQYLWSSHQFFIVPCSLFAPVIFYCSGYGMNGYNTRSKPDVPVFEFLLQQTVLISKESSTCLVYCWQAFDAEAHGPIIFLYLPAVNFRRTKINHYWSGGSRLMYRIVYGANNPPRAWLLGMCHCLAGMQL